MIISDDFPKVRRTKERKKGFQGKRQKKRSKSRFLFEKGEE